MHGMSHGLDYLLYGVHRMDRGFQQPINDLLLFSIPKKPSKNVSLRKSMINVFGGMLSGLGVR